VIDGQAVDAGSAGSPVTGDPVERHDQRRRVVHEVEQVIKPAAGIGRRPTMKFGLHLRYPPDRTHVRAGVAVRRRVLRHYSIHPFA
jgi:hypothetical protein